MLNGKRGKVFKGLQSSGKEEGARGRSWLWVGEVWVLLMQLREKHFAHTHKQVLGEQGQKPGPVFSPAMLQVPSLQHELEEHVLELGWLVLG